jgi:hypothetical protein
LHLTLLASPMGPKLRSFSVQSAVTLPNEKYRDSRVLVIAASSLHFIPTALLIGFLNSAAPRLPARSRPSAPITAGSCLSRRPSRSGCLKVSAGRPCGRTHSRRARGIAHRCNFFAIDPSVSRHDFLLLWQSRGRSAPGALPPGAGNYPRKLRSWGEQLPVCARAGLTSRKLYR